jgi:hypothetical protein
MGYSGGQAVGVPAERTCKNCKGGMKILEGSRIHDITGELISNGMLPYKQDALYNQLWHTSRPVGQDSVPSGDNEFYMGQFQSLPGVPHC